MPGARLFGQSVVITSSSEIGRGMDDEERRVGVEPMFRSGLHNSLKGRYDY
jgi:hypothetical protein